MQHYQTERYIAQTRHKYSRTLSPWHFRFFQASKQIIYDSNFQSLNVSCKKLTRIDDIMLSQH